MNSEPPRVLYDRAFAAAFLSQLGFVLANTLMAHYARWINHLGGGVREVGWIMGAGAVAGLLLRPWMAQWINRLGARNMWATGYLLFGAASLGNLLLHDLGWPIYALRSLSVLGGAIVFASSLTYVSRISPVERRTEAIGILGVAGFSGMLVGPLLGDVILGTGERSREDFVVLFASAAAVLVLPAFLLLFLRASTSERGSPVGLKDFLSTVRRHWPGTILLVNFAFGVCMTVPFGFLADYVDVTELSIDGMSAVGFFFFGYAGWGIVVRVGLRKVPDRHGRRRVLLAGLFFLGTGMFSFLLVHPAQPWTIIVPGLICGTGHALTFHTMSSLALEPFPIAVRGTGSGLSLVMLDLGTIGGAPILGHVAATWGYRWLFISVGCACWLVALIYTGASIPVWRRRWLERRARQ